MIMMIDPARAKRAQSAQDGAGSTKGVFLPYSELRSIEVLSEPPARQMAWLRLVAYLLEMGLPGRGECRFPDSDTFWMTVCGLSCAQMHEPNGLWGFDAENMLHLHVDAEEAVV